MKEDFEHIKLIMTQLLHDIYDIFKPLLYPLVNYNNNSIDGTKVINTVFNDEDPVVCLSVIPSFFKKENEDINYRINFRISINTDQSSNNHIVEFMLFENVNVTAPKMKRFNLNDNFNEYTGFNIMDLFYIPNYALPILNIGSLVSDQIRTIYERNIRGQEMKGSDLYLYSKCKKDFMRINYIGEYFKKNINILDDDTKDKLTNEFLFVKLRSLDPYKTFEKCVKYDYYTSDSNKVKNDILPIFPLSFIEISTKRSEGKYVPPQLKLGSSYKEKSWGERKEKNRDERKEAKWGERKEEKYVPKRWGERKEKNWGEREEK